MADLIEKAAEQEIKHYQPNNEYPTYYYESNMIDMFNAGSIFAFNYIKKQNSKETGQREAIAFAEWVRDNAEWQLCEWVVKGKKRPLTTAELYQQFLNQPGIQPSDIKPV